jgi:type IV pilus assembly protein PilC
MPIYVYSAAKKTGEVVKGEKEAGSQKELAAALKSEDLLLFDAKEKSKVKMAGFNINIDSIISRLRPISLIDKMVFARNLAVMIGAGLSLTKAIAALVEEANNQKFKNILSDVNSSIIKGKTFAEALKPHEKIFGELFINMVSSGEASGKLERVLKLLARQMKRDHDLRSRVKGAMMYPTIILIALFGIGALMMVYVIPTLAATIKELDAPLPLSTKIIISVSDVLTNYGLWVILGLLVAAVIFYRLLKTKKGKAIFDTIILKAPIFGSLVKKFNSARMARTLSYLISSGVPIVGSLEITSSVLGNTLYRRALSEAGAEIQKGKQLNEILRLHPELFQPIVLQMIQVGEETGKISSMLLRIALFFEEDVNNTTKNLSTIIEPLLMIFIGAIVGFFAVSMLQPIYGSLGNL